MNANTFKYCGVSEIYSYLKTLDFVEKIYNQATPDDENTL
jgi:hypothetical protein